jgi:hypothetical protein
MDPQLTKPKYVAPKKLFCPTTACNHLLAIHESRGGFRRRLCDKGHVHFTEGDEFISETAWNFGVAMWRRTLPSRQDQRPKALKAEKLPEPPPESAPEVKPQDARPPTSPLNTLSQHVFVSEDKRRRAYISVGADAGERVRMPDKVPKLTQESFWAANPFGLTPLVDPKPDCKED